MGGAWEKAWDQFREPAREFVLVCRKDDEPVETIGRTFETDTNNALRPDLEGSPTLISSSSDKELTSKKKVHFFRNPHFIPVS